MQKILKCGLYLTFLFDILYIKAQVEKTTHKTIIVETTTELVTIITDIPQSDVELALNPDVGKFTTMIYNYMNKQYENNLKYERCFDDFTKCLITQSTLIPVCGVNDPSDKREGFVSYNSYCELYFDNCLRGMRFWRTLGPGKCNVQYSGDWFTVDRTRKYLLSLFRTNKSKK